MSGFNFLFCPLPSDVTGTCGSIASRLCTTGEPRDTVPAGRYVHPSGCGKRLFCSEKCRDGVVEGPFVRTRSFGDGVGDRELVLLRGERGCARVAAARWWDKHKSSGRRVLTVRGRMDIEVSGDADVDLVLECSMIAATSLLKYVVAYFLCLEFCNGDGRCRLKGGGGQIRESIRGGFLERDINLVGQLNSARDKGVNRKEEQIFTGNIEKKKREGDGEKESKMEH